MRQPRSITAVVAVAATVGLLLAGCATSGPTEAGSTGPLPELTPDLYKGVDLTIWGGSVTAETPALKDAFAAFEEASGAQIDVELIPPPLEQNVLTKWTAGEHPDIMFWNPIAGQIALLNGAQTLLPLDGEDWWSKVPDATQKVSGIADGKPHAAIFQFPSATGIFYNKQVFEDAGVEVPTGGFADFVSVAKKIDAAGVTPIYEVGGDKWPLQWITDVLLAEATADGWADRLNTGEESFSDETFVDAVTDYASLQADGLVNDDVVTATFENQLKALYEGEVGMIAQITSVISILNENYGADEVDKHIGFFPLSLDGDLLTWSPEQAGTLVLPKTGDTKSEEASRQFLKFLFSEEYYPVFLKEAGVAPALDGFDDAEGQSEVTLSVLDAFNNGAVPQWDTIALAKPDIHLYIDELINGRLDPEGVAAAMDDQFRKTLKAQGVEGF